MSQCGIVVACDQNQEWLLSWWWENYSKFNSHPVLFVDFGMSAKAVAWCKKRGGYKPLEGFESFQERAVPEEKQTLWESRISSISIVRSTLFKKPFAMKQSPFQFSIWVDLDCEVKGSLDSLFSLLLFGVEFAARKYPDGYNSGVVAFRKDSKILLSWLEEIIQRNERYIHDEEALSILREPIFELPDAYNWNPLFGSNPCAVVIHYQGGFLKEEIKKRLPGRRRTK